MIQSAALLHSGDRYKHYSPQLPSPWTYNLLKSNHISTRESYSPSSPCSDVFEPDQLSSSKTRQYYQHHLIKSILWESSGTSNRSNDLSRIVVIWAESFDDTLRFPVTSLPTELGSEKETPCIVIFVTPLKSGLFKTNVIALSQRSKYNTSGILDEYKKVVSEHILPIVVRETCLYIRTSSLLEQNPAKRPSHIRQQLIDKIIEENRCKDKGNAFFNLFFNSE